MLGALLLGKQPEMLEEMNHQWQLWDCRLNEFNAVWQQNKDDPCTGFGNKPMIICAFFRWLLSVSFDFIQWALDVIGV